MKTQAVANSAGDPMRHRLLVVFVAMGLLAVACGSDETVDQQASEETAGEDSTVTGEPAEPGSESGSPAAAADFVTYQLQRRAIVSTAEQVIGDGDPTGQLVWELQCRWVPDQAALARAALPWPPPDTSSQWRAYVAATDTYWAEYENACDAYDPSTFDAEPDFRDALRAGDEAQLGACQALVAALEPRLPSGVDVPVCSFQGSDPIGVDTFPDLPSDLEEFLSAES